jgi:hypothetical protein
MRSLSPALLHRTSSRPSRADKQRAISHGNAWTLFPRLALSDTSKKAVNTGNVSEFAGAR